MSELKKDKSNVYLSLVGIITKESSKMAKHNSFSYIKVIGVFMLTIYYSLEKISLFLFALNKIH